MTYPILEYDPTPEAFIEPAQVNRPRDMPEHCVICFFKETLAKIITENQAEILVENHWEDGPHSVYEITHRNQRLAFYHPGVGGSLAAGTLEEVIAFGCRKFIACGGCGVLDQKIGLGHLVVVSAAVRDEGVSYHYLPPARQVVAQEQGILALTHTLRDRGLPYSLGMTWTTDAPYRETPGKIADRKREGCVVVEMECASMMAVAQFRNAIFGQLLYGGDDLSGQTWDHRHWQSQADVRENLFWICADACLIL